MRPHSVTVLLSPLLIVLAWVSIVAAETATSNSTTDPIQLAVDGKSEYVLCIPQDAPPELLKCANTLQKYIREVSGALIPISIGSSIARKRIQFELSASEDTTIDIAALHSDGFIIRTRGDDFFFTAATAYGLRNAVYTFLESYLGCRVFSPTERFTPKRSDITISAVFDRQVPAITFRMQNIHDSTYTTWHKLNTYDDFGLFVHTFQLLVPPSRHFSDHPEYFSMLKGNRTPDGQLCLTNPDVLRIVCDELRTRMQAKPQATFWSVSQNDTYVPCECDGCRAIDSVEGSPSGSILAFVNKVAEQFPDKTISTLAYQYSRSAPRTLKPLPNVNIMLCSIECNRSKPLAEDLSNASFVRDVEDWSRLTNNIFLWDYVIDFRHLLSPFPNLHVLQPNIQFFASHGITTVFEQGLSGFGGEFSELRSYLISKLLWNPDVNIDSVMQDFLVSYYGPAAPYIRQYIDTMHAALINSGEGLDIYGYPVRSANGYLSLSMLDTYNQIFDRAEAAVSGNANHLGRVHTARLPVQYVMLEQAKVAGAGEHGCFQDADNGILSPRPEIDSLLTLFVRRCKDAAIPRLWEHGITPDEYYTATRRFLDSGAKNHLARGKEVTLAAPASEKYHGGDKAALTDGLLAWDDYHMHWLGFEGEEMDATIDLGTSQTFSRIHTNFLQDINSWIFMPDTVNFFVSEDGVTFRPVGVSANITPAEKWGPIIASFNLDCQPIPARYIRVKTASKKICPTWHKGSGGLAWIFIDEITVE